MAYSARNRMAAHSYDIGFTQQMQPCAFLMPLLDKRQTG